MNLASLIKNLSESQISIVKTHLNQRIPASKKSFCQRRFTLPNKSMINLLMNSVTPQLAFSNRPNKPYKALFCNIKSKTISLIRVLRLMRRPISNTFKTRYIAFKLKSKFQFPSINILCLVYCKFKFCFLINKTAKISTIPPSKSNFFRHRSNRNLPWCSIWTKL